MQPSPILTTLCVPFLVSFGASGLLRGRANEPRRAAATGSAIGCGFVAAFVALTGEPPFAGSAPHHAVASVAVSITAAGLLLALLKPSDRMLKFLIVSAAMLGIGWCFGFAAVDLSRLGVALPIGLIVSIRLAYLVDNGVGTVALIAITGAGLWGIAMAGHGALGSELSLAFVAACIGWLVQARGRAKAVTAGIAILIGGTMLLVLGADMARTALEPPWPILLLPPCLWGDRIAHRLGLGAMIKRKKSRALGAALGASAPVVAAIALAAALAVSRRHGAS